MTIRRISFAAKFFLAIHLMVQMTYTLGAAWFVAPAIAASHTVQGHSEQAQAAVTVIWTSAALVAAVSAAGMLALWGMGRRPAHAWPHLMGVTVAAAETGILFITASTGAYVACAQAAAVALTIGVVLPLTWRRQTTPTRGRRPAVETAAKTTDRSGVAALGSSH